MTESKKNFVGIMPNKFSLEFNKEFFHDPIVWDTGEYSNVDKVKYKILNTPLPLQIEHKLLKLVDTLDKENINLAEQILNTYTSGKMEI